MAQDVQMFGDAAFAERAREVLATRTLPGPVPVHDGVAPSAPERAARLHEGSSRHIRIVGRPAAWRHVCMANERTVEMGDLHMIVLGRIAHHASAAVDDIAGWLGVPVVLAEALCAELEAAGLLTAARGH